MLIEHLPRISLNNIRNVPGAVKKAVRVGRGPGSGRGGTSGRGHKGAGQHAARRSKPGFAGGTTPLYRTQPKRGFKNPHKVTYEPLNLAKLQDFINRGKIDPSKPISMRVLSESGAVGKVEHGVKLLGDGADIFQTAVTIEVSKASKSAIESIEAAGGKIVTAYYNKLGLRALIKPHKFDILPRRARPRPKEAEYYSDPENRGYLVGTTHEEATEFFEKPRGMKKPRTKLHAKGKPTQRKFKNLSPKLVAQARSVARRVTPSA